MRIRYYQVEGRPPPEELVAPPPDLSWQPSQVWQPTFRAAFPVSTLAAIAAMGAFVPPEIQAEALDPTPALVQQAAPRYVRLSISGWSQSSVPPIIPFNVALADTGSRITYRSTGYAQARADPPPQIIAEELPDLSWAPHAPVPTLRRLGAIPQERADPPPELIAPPPPPNPAEWTPNTSWPGWVRLSIFGQTVTAVPPLIPFAVELADTGTQTTYRRLAYAQGRADPPPELISEAPAVLPPAPDGAAERVTAQAMGPSAVVYVQSSADPPEILYFPPSQDPQLWRGRRAPTISEAEAKTPPTVTPPAVIAVPAPDQAAEVSSLWRRRRATPSQIQADPSPPLIAPDLSWSQEAGRTTYRRAAAVQQVEVRPPTLIVVPPPPDLSWMPRNLDPPLRYLRAQPQYLAEGPLRKRMVVYVDLLSRLATEKRMESVVEPSLDLRSVVDRLEQS